MTNQPVTSIQPIAVHLFARAGVYSSAPASGAPPEGLGAILLFALVGAFLGLLVGIMISHIVRYISFVMGRNIGGYGWVILTTLAGAVWFAWMAATANSES